jgi:hypothetical protein
MVCRFLTVETNTLTFRVSEYISCDVDVEDDTWERRYVLTELTSLILARGRIYPFFLFTIFAHLNLCFFIYYDIPSPEQMELVS